MSSQTIRRGTLIELFRHNDWARDRLLETAAPLSDEQLDRPFEMGPGSLRGVLNHHCVVERVWLQRWQAEAPQYRADAAGVSIAQLRQESAATVAERDALINQSDDAAIAKPLTFTMRSGATYTFPLGDLMLHVANHGVYHRAQAANIFRHLGVKVPGPGIDYIFMRLEQPVDASVSIDRDTIRAYIRYSDWARSVVHEAAKDLTAEQLDRPFDMGVGSLRKTLAHIFDAERWWYRNWTEGPGGLFPEPDAQATPADIEASFCETAQKRDAFLDALPDADILRPVDVTPRPGMIRTFPIGVSMLQMCVHGTHHRAQAVNMLRHVGGRVPQIDYVEMLRLG